MYDLGGSSFLYSVGKDLWNNFRGRRRSMRNAKVLELRQKWKPKFEAETANTHREKLAKDVIIRDVKRIDEYPDIDQGAKGISPWFRAGLMNTYDKGFLVELRWCDLTEDTPGKWRYTNYGAGEIGEVRSILIGRVPYENVQDVDWNGDEYYYFPHIYCHFDGKEDGPYDELVFCEQKTPPDMQPYYVDVASYDDVRQRNEELGIRPSM